MANVNGGLVDYRGGCRDCDATWHSRNVMGLAAQHADKYGHQAWVELGSSFEVTPGKKD